MASARVPLYFKLSLPFTTTFKTLNIVQRTYARYLQNSHNKYALIFYTKSSNFLVTETKCAFCEVGTALFRWISGSEGPRRNFWR